MLLYELIPYVVLLVVHFRNVSHLLHIIQEGKIQTFHDIHIRLRLAALMSNVSSHTVSLYIMHSPVLIATLSCLLLVTGVRAYNGSGSHGPPPSANPLTYGFYATPEIPEPVPLEITGKLPSWLRGSLYRGAAGTWDTGNLTAEHWFDGFSRNHRFEIANGQVEYRSRNATDELVAFIRETGKLPDGSFGSDPCKIIFGAFEATFRDGNATHSDKASANVDVSYVVDYPALSRNTSSFGSPMNTLVATTDGNYLQQIDPVTLEPIEISTYQAANPLLKNAGRSAAHPAFGSDGSIYNYVLDLVTKPPVYRVFGVSPENGAGTILANITDAPPAYLHSLFSTESHLLLVVWQADIGKKAATLLGSLLPWDLERKTLFYVISKTGGGVISKYASPDAFFAFHQINAFEDASGAIIIDLPTADDYHFLTSAMVDNLRANVGPNANGSSYSDITFSFTRYLLPNYGDTIFVNGSMVSNPAIKSFSLDYQKHNIELPRINSKYAGKAYQYAYGVHTAKPGYFTDSLIKIDTKARTSLVWEPKTNHLPSEPVFVANPTGSGAEDDGVLLTVAMDAERKKSSLIAINATTMVELGRAQMPIAMGYGFHGVFGSGM